MTAPEIIAAGTMDVLVGTLEIVGQNEAAHILATSGVEVPAVVDAAIRADPHAIAQSVVELATSALTAAGQGLAASIVSAAWGWLGPWLQGQFGATIEGTHVEGTAHLQPSDPRSPSSAI